MLRETSEERSRRGSCQHHGSGTWNVEGDEFTDAFGTSIRSLKVSKEQNEFRRLDGSVSRGDIHGESVSDVKSASYRIGKYSNDELRKMYGLG